MTRTRDVNYARLVEVNDLLAETEGVAAQGATNREDVKLLPGVQLLVAKHVHVLQR